jgi:vancomycin resistance protein VanJ
MSTKNKGGRPEDPRKRRRATRWILSFTIVHLAVLGGVELLNWIGPEKWWASGVNLYIPQWSWGLPGLFLTAAAIRYCRKWVWLPFLSLIWVAGPIMGFCWGSPEEKNPPRGSVRLRVMTYNIKYGRKWPEAIAAQIVRQDPDIMVIQDVGLSQSGIVGKVLKDRIVKVSGPYLVASRYPVEDLIAGHSSIEGLSHTYIRTRINVRGTFVNLIDVHFVTPRAGLNAVREESAQGLDELRQNIQSRLIQADHIASLLGSIKGPVILAGDLNAPVQSLVCRKLMDAGLRDAFSVAGRGYGYTYGHSFRLRHSFMRIDHIMANDALKIQKCWVGEKEGAEHRPVIAELILTPAKRAER